MEENDFFMTTKDMVLTIIILVVAMTLVISCVAFIVSTLS